MCIRDSLAVDGIEAEVDVGRVIAGVEVVGEGNGVANVGVVGDKEARAFCGIGLIFAAVEVGIECSRGELEAGFKGRLRDGIRAAGEGDGRGASSSVAEIGGGEGDGSWSGIGLWCRRGFGSWFCRGSWLSDADGEGIIGVVAVLVEVA